MNQLTDTVYTAYVGIDWADAKHDICVQAAGSEDRAFDIDIETCSECGREVKIVTCIEDPVVIRKILAHLDEMQV